MTKLTKENLEELIGQRIEIFKNVDEAVSKYNAEQETIKEYNGRQILELIQNADDAGAKTISITLNTERNELVFYNDGVAFDFEGIKSIMIANLSSKITATYIGNKGLGFRSILNWAQSVTIYSAGLGIEFSRKVLEEYLENKLLSLKSNLDEIRKSRNLSPTCIPIPILGLPRVSEKPYEGCTEDKGCALKIIYDESKQEDIINQIKAIDERTLLFLPKVKTVNVEVDAQKSTISDNEEEWNIYDIEDELPDQYQDKNKNENKKYIVKIAIPKIGLIEGSNSLYNYLPTKEQVHLPFLLHATVELNSSRNHVNESDVNVYILEQAAALIQDYAQKELDTTNGSSNWTAFRMMTPTVHEKDYGSLKPLYIKLTELKKTMSIYPTVDKQYVTADKYCYYNDDISSFWMNFDAHGTSFSKMLQQTDGQYKIETHPLEDFADALTAISQSIAGDIQKRVSLIRHLFDNKDLYNPQAKIPLLIDGNNGIISDRAYIQDNGDEALTNNLPDWVDFKIIHPDLTNQLIEEFTDEIENVKQQKKQDSQQYTSKVRCLVELLEDFVDIHYFDKTRIAIQVVSQINAKSDDVQIDERIMIGRMLDYLYNLGSDAKLENVNLLNEDGDVMKADNLMLPTKLNKLVFEKTDTHYVLNLNGWKKMGFLSELNEWEFENFMLKLGVNRLLNEKKLHDLFYNGYNRYLDSHKIFTNNPGQKQFDLYKGSSDIKIQVLRESIMDKLKKISLNNILLFVASNTEVFECLRKSIDFRFFYIKLLPNNVSTPYNYIRYQISTLPSVKWIVFGNDLILDSEVNINNLKQKTPNVTDVVNWIRTDFRFESTNEIRDFLIKSPEIFPDGKNIQKLYKLVVDGLADSEERLNNVRLFASDADGKKDYHPSTEVFYSDNTCLPKKVIKKLNLYKLDYPSRQGAEKVSNIFGLFRINDLNFQIENFQDSDYNKEFNNFFFKLRPYFLLYAIQNTSKETSLATIAGYIKKCNIHLVSKCSYSIKGEEHADLDEGEFINVGNDYYLNVGNIANIEVMKSSTLYCNAITEILGMTFKLETKNEDFIYVFQNFDFMKKYIDETREEKIEECYNLLGISSEEKRFWEKYGELKGLKLDAETPNFYSRNSSILGFCEQDVKNANFSEWNNKESVNFLNKVLNTLESDVHKKELLGIVNLSTWHKYRFDSVKTEYTRAFVHKLWTLLNDKYQDKRSEFFSIQDAYSSLSYENGWEHELKSDAEYLNSLNEKITALFNKVEINAEGDICNESPKDEHTNLYPKLIQSIQEEKDMEGERWMLYFDGYKEQIEEKKSSLMKEEETEDSNATSVSEESVNGKFVDIKVESKIFHTSTKASSKSPSTHKTMSDRRKAKLGKDAEERVDVFLRKKEQEGVCQYGEWVSKRDDSAGYDFTYIVDGQKRLLEVKHSYDNTFIISANEYNVADKNKDVYDIAIVNGNTITIYKSFFLGKPRMEEKDYYVSFDVKNE